MNTKQKIINKIEEFIGENQPFKVSENMELREGYNQAKDEIRFKAPQLAEEILEVVVGEINQITQDNHLDYVDIRQLTEILTQDSDNK
jgi:hypothetical protein